MLARSDWRTLTQESPPSMPEREFKPPYPMGEHQGRLLFGDPVAESFEWLTRWIAKLGWQPEKVFALAVHKRNAWSDYLVSPAMGSDLAGVRIPPEFWDNYEKFFNEKVPLRDRRTAFP